MEIKRYNPICAPLGGGSYMPEMQECANGQYYSRADLIAAGVLVSVPDGDACAADDARNNHTFIMCGGEVFVSEPHLWDWVRLDGTYAELNDDIFVQPISLVRLEDVG